MLSRRELGCAVCAAMAMSDTAVAQAPGAIKRTTLQETTEGDLKTIMMLVEVPAGVEIAAHTHPGIETSYVLEGEGELRVAGQGVKAVTASSSFQVPRGTVHALQNVKKPMKVAVTYVVDKDKPLATPASF